MTLGEKLKQARKEAGYSQEQLAEKLAVSRSAIAKWEADKGMPDVANLKNLAQLLNVSVDYLLAEDDQFSFNELKEAINLTEYEKSGNCRSREDAAILAKYPEAEAITPLVRFKKLSAVEQVWDFIIQPGVLQVADQLENRDAYYLVEQKGRQYLVRITKDFMFTNELTQKVTGRRFVIGKNKFTKANYVLK